MSEYSDIVALYAKNPWNNYVMEDFTISHKEESRQCWDTIEVFLKIEGDIIIDYSFTWNTSIVTKAAASIFWESIIWMNISEIIDYKIEYVIDLIWEVSPRRKFAAALWLLATRNAMHKYMKDWVLDDFSDVLE